MERSIAETLKRLREAGWFSAPSGSASSGLGVSSCTDIRIPSISSQVIKEWKTSINAQEKAAIAKRHNTQDPANAQNPAFQVPSTVSGPAYVSLKGKAGPTVASHLSSHTSPSTCESPEELVEHIGRDHKLNQEQMIAFKILATKFIEVFDEIMHSIPEDQSLVSQLKMMMIGPGGTGKTHII
ncbi:hypothetical protein FRC01_012958 [Tulasnella sp. 417]|nr:hypothetical protein FRC01_012958 [Tulasnella sp. 417]